jgi:hypothetical protein
MTLVEKIARTIRPMAWTLNESGELLNSRRIDRDDAMRDAHRALAALADPANVTDEMVSAATQTLLLDQDQMTLGAIDEIRRAIAAALRSTLPDGKTT